MKQLFIFYILCPFLLLLITSCTDKDESIHKVEPGIYYIGKDLNTVVTNTQTRGIDSKNYEFDTNYDYDYIYLHKIGSEECIEIPVYENCPSNTGTICNKGFRYRVEVDETGNATITPLDKEGNKIEGIEPIKLNANEQCYFSSWPTDTWAMNNNQFSEERWADQNESYYLYYRDKNINKEIYRSGEGSKYNDLSVEDLVTNGDLILTRACATFSLGAVFYSDSTPIHLDEENTIYMTDEDTFNIVMGDIYKDWYIKIYLGGQCFPTSYNIETNKTFNDHPNGYYSSGDAVKFGNSDLTGKVYLPFNKKSFSIDFETFNGFGYFSDYQNTLLTPVTGTHQLKVYLLIKHWTGGPDGPSEEWLKSDIGALQTIISQSGVVAEPENAAAFKIRFAIELKVFKKAWEDAGGDAAQNELIENAGIDTGTKTSSEDKSSSSLNTAIYSTTLTRSPSGDPVRSFTLPEDAIIIQEVY